MQEQTQKRQCKCNEVNDELEGVISDIDKYEVGLDGCTLEVQIRQVSWKDFIYILRMEIGSEHDKYFLSEKIKDVGFIEKFDSKVRTVVFFKKDNDHPINFSELFDGIHSSPRKKSHDVFARGRRFRRWGGCYDVNLDAKCVDDCEKYLNYAHAHCNCPSATIMYCVVNENC